MRIDAQIQNQDAIRMQFAIGKAGSETRQGQNQDALRDEKMSSTHDDLNDGELFLAMDIVFSCQVKELLSHYDILVEEEVNLKTSVTPSSGSRR